MDEIDLKKVLIDRSLVNVIPEDIARENCLTAFRKFNGKIYIAIDNVPNFQLREKLKFVVKMDISFFKADRKEIFRFIDSLYSREKLDCAVNDIDIEDVKVEREDSSKFINSPVVKAVNYIIERAVNERASDIHIEPFENDVNIRFRIDGSILNYTRIPKRIYSSICTRIKIMGDMNIAEKRIPQDGKISFSIGRKNYDIRVSILPTVYGEKIVLRILYKDKKILNLEKLGFLSQDADKIIEMASRPSGIILVVGPTGSGKSTTIYSLLNNMDKERKNIVSIEDPVEYTIEGVNQVNVNNKVGVNFASGLRAILRQDPDVIMVGEIRDEETASIAVKAAITGHLVLSTLHTKNAKEAVLRLESMGVPSYFIKDALIGVISQRLVKKLCMNCRKMCKNNSKNIFNKDVNDIVYKNEGCSKCNYTGYIGRTVLYEISFIDHGNIDINTIRNNSENLINNGITSIDEINKFRV
ncbi:type II/IV secretion system protein [Clostridium sp. cel8]|uniref:GspE/PulE family protein n=1 Tax=Clostridium sp. cel8 TaxID=2663123 RepID=UPI0015F636D3|nr:GspE/PulE family protein [Clostridium sp. cel8]MBA5850635.1 type II/IV secretion system protein [Clostridium sp. cel8]